MEEIIRTDQKPEKEKKKFNIWEYVRIVVFACIAGLLINHFVLINAVIPSGSMENLLQIHDQIFGCRLSYLFHGPERYDVVMFPYPVDGKTLYIKRVIGLPGEKVEIKEGKIYIDDSRQPIEENYLPEKWTVNNDGYVFEVPDDCYLMLGDNRNISEDSRVWPENAIDGGVASSEEEAQKYSYVHKDTIVGRAILKYYPHFSMFLNI